jgi:hypothetical protein
VPAVPVELDVDGTLLENVNPNAKFATVIVLDEGDPAGSRSTKTLSVLATLAAVGSSDSFLLLSDIHKPFIKRRGKYCRQ